MGPFAPISVAACLIFDSYLHICYNFPVLMSLLAKLVWWYYGMVYDYSSVNIQRTYVYS